MIFKNEETLFRANEFIRQRITLPFRFDFRLLAAGWDARAYLRRRYPATRVFGAEIEIYKRVVSRLKQLNRRFDRAIDVGCGPTIHQMIPFVPYVREFHLADFLLSNLAEVYRWQQGEAEAHDWDAYFRAVLELESPELGFSADLQRAAASRKSLLAACVSQLRLCDLNRSHPLGDGVQYDLVTAFYCVETAGGSPYDWPWLLNNLCSLLTPGGTLFLALLRNQNFYPSGQGYLPAACLDETELQVWLASSPLDQTNAQVEVIRLSQWEDTECSGILLLDAPRPAK